MQQISFLVNKCFEQVYVPVNIEDERKSNKSPKSAITALIADSQALSEPFISKNLEGKKIPAEVELVHAEPTTGYKLYTRFQKGMPRNLLSQKRYLLVNFLLYYILPVREDSDPKGMDIC